MIGNKFELRNSKASGISVAVVVELFLIVPGTLTVSAHSTAGTYWGLHHERTARHFG
jgi:hypothetical protein